MQTFLLALAFTSLQLGQLSTPPVPGFDWPRVQVLPIGTTIQVATKTGHSNCKLKSVDADAFTCTQGKDVVFQRADIVIVKVHRRGRSTLIGMAIGAGAGFGYASGACPAGKGCIVSRPAGAAIFAIPGAGVSAIIGFFINSATSTVYKAPLRNGHQISLLPASHQKSEEL